MVHALQLTLLVSLAGAPKSPSIEDAWRRLPLKGSACAEADLGFDYELEGGMRNFYCRALQVMPWSRFIELAGVAPFLSGPHQGGALNLNSETAFGHYDPAFVKWAGVALLPAANNDGLRRATQATYDKQVRSLARAYYRVWRVVFADKAWLTRTRDGYLGDATHGGGGWSSPALTPLETLLGPAEADWGGVDPNLQRSAAAWWLRRSADETDALWSAALERLLTTYDAAWLKSERVKKVKTPGAAK
jgi:hypothetical protein